MSGREIDERDVALEWGSEFGNYYGDLEMIQMRDGRFFARVESYTAGGWLEVTVERAYGFLALTEQSMDEGRAPE